MGKATEPILVHGCVEVVLDGGVQGGVSQILPYKNPFSHTGSKLKNK